MRAGKHIARATGQYEFGVTDNGKENVALTFVIIEGPAAGERCSAYLYFTEKTTERTLESLRYCGWAGDNVTDLTGIDTNPVELDVQEDTYEGKTRLKVAWINALRGPQVKNAMDDNAKKAFAARMKGAAMAVDKSKAAKVDYTPAAVAPSAGDYDGGGQHDGDPGPSDDDIPF